MRTVSIRLIVVLFCFVPICGVSAEPMSSGTVQERLDHVERVIGSRALTNLLERIDDLQREIQELRGQVEMQAYALSQTKQSQRDYYLDLNKRLQQLEVATGSGATISRFLGNPNAKIPPAVEFDVTGVQEKSVRLEKPVNNQTVDHFTNSQLGNTESYSNYAQNNAYEEAFGLLKKKHYSEAIISLKAFLDRYPHGQYVESAQYWLGEAYYVTQQFKPALSMFQKLLREYPTSLRINDALLKIGYIQGKLGQTTEAEQTLGNLIDQYPDSTQAHLARRYLQKILRKTP
uniref:Cell division coordinator CpoB n=1 Tax=Candidatus Kentrum sp. LFY TaxID=2126342 RepID=A0A450V4X1_9GAMM|nr:MAG: tol-pal system protein YbgF [Candidatus Kentron sp. LFY]